jgi:hypothetical protein
MKMLNNLNTRGSVLVMVMVLLLAFSMLTVSLLQTGRDSSLQSIQEQRNAQAHWVAEAGLEKVMARIYASRDYRDGLPSNPSEPELDKEALEGDASKGHYTVWVYKTDGPGLEESTYLIESTGTVSNALISAEAKVRIGLIGAPGVHQGLLGLGGESYVKQSASIEINGDVYIKGIGDVNRPINGDLEDADDGIVVTYGGNTVSVDELIIPPLDPAHLPAGSTPTYQTLLTYASDTNNAGVIHGTYNGPFDLTSAANHTIYVNGNVNIEDNVTGSGAIVATGTVTFNKNGKTLDSLVTVVANGDLTVTPAANNITFGENTVLFSGGNISISGNQNLPTVGLSLLAMGDITISANIIFNGIMYANGKVLLVDGTQDITGTIIAGDGFDVRSNTTITYDPSVFPDPVPIDFLDNFARTQRLQWEENPYN